MAARLLWGAAVIAIWGGAAVACDREAATGTLQEAARVGLVVDLEVTAAAVVLYMSRRDWDGADIGQRRHLARLVQCAVVGGDARLQRLELRDAGGVLLGVFDGVRDRLEVVR